MALNYFVPVVDEDDQPKLSKVNKDSLVSGSNGRWHAWSDTIQDIRDRALEASQLYIENRPDKLEYATPDDAAQSLSRIRRPVLAQAIDSTISQQHLGSFPADERFFKGKPKNRLADENMDSYESHVEARLSLVDFMMSALKDRKNKMIAGTSAVWNPFIRETEIKTSYQFRKIFGIELPIGKPRAVRKETVTFEGTAYIPINFEDWRVDPLVDNLKEANFIWRRWVNKEELEAVKAFENTKDLTSYSDTWPSADSSGSNKQTIYQQMGINPTYTGDSYVSKEMVLLYEEWGDFYVDGEYFHNHVLIYANDAVFLYFGPNPYNHQRKPFSVSAYIPMSGTLYGKSLAQDIIPLAHAEDTLLNQGIDIISKTGNPTFTYLVTDKAIEAFFDGDTVSLIPGEGIPCQSHDSIRPIVWDRAALQEIASIMQMLKEEIRESTGGVPYTTGGASATDQDRTATEVSTLAAGTNTRFQLFIQIYEQQKLKPFLQMIFENDRQFMTEPVFVEDQAQPLMPNTLKMMELDFDVTGSRAIINRAKEIQDIDTVLGAVPNWLGSGLVKANGDVLEVNVPELIKRSLTMKGISDLDNVVDVITAQEQEMNLAVPGGMGGPTAVPQANPGGAPVNLAAA
jgi:hypothetical protein